MCVNDSLKSKIITIKIKWNNAIVTAYNMLKDCYRIIEIDLSYFNTSQIYNMTRMFDQCY